MPTYHKKEVKLLIKP